ncbi:MAG: MBL fold metallo-hydrolase [Candidatus Dadabacteria bacterium]
MKIPFFALMPLYVASLNSGSNGNCYYIGNESEAILIDIGIACREVEKRMKRLGLSVTKIKAIFISHEHTDHIKGLQVFANKFKIPVFISAPTFSAMNCSLQRNLLYHFQALEKVVVGNLKVVPFPKKHDAVDPFSFTISDSETIVGVFTDIGTPCDHLVNHFKTCHAAFLESNYDEVMLHKGTYPFHLKRRIMSDHGHLSNAQALNLFKKERPGHMTHLILSHLSKNNNDPTLVKELFEPHAEGVNVIIASRYKETAIYKIQPAENNRKICSESFKAQLELF